MGTVTDERLKWLEQRIGSSMRPRNEDLKNMMANDENRLAFYEFVNNEDVKRLLVYMRPGRQIVATLQPPMELQSKTIYFLKCNPGTKLTKDNMDSEVYYTDSSNVPLDHLEMTIREVFLPLLSTNNLSLASASGQGDKVMDILHRLMAAVEVTQGHVEGRIVLNLPSIEVLAEAAASPSRRAAVLHVLETTVIGWIKQIRAVLRHDPQEALTAQFGKEPGPLDEIAMWETHLDRLRSINDQLASDVAKDILQNLETANSQYAQSFSGVRKDISKAEAETTRILKFLSTMEPWYKKLHGSTDSQAIIKLFKPLMHVLNLVWSYSTYYHQIDKFHQLIRLLSNEVVHRAIAMVGDDILREPLESYSKLKEALRVCAAFRGTYLDFKDKADDQNAKNIAENAEKLAARPQGNLFTTKMYGPHAYAPRYGLRHLDGGSSSNSMDEDELWMDSPWPARNAPCFDLLNNFMERCNDVLELVETTRHFRLLAGAAEVGGAGSASLDAMVKELHIKYSIAMKEFFSQVSNVLSIDGTQMFERAFFNFRTTVKALEKRLSGILRLAFEQCGIVQSQLRLLEVFEGVSGRELVQAHLKDVDKQLVYNFSEELQQCRSIFKERYYAPPPHHNMPPIVSKLMWVHALKERIRIPMEKMRQVSPHSLEGDRGYHMRETYTEVMGELEGFESNIVAKWQTDIVSELTSKLKQPLLIAEEYDDEIDVRPQVIHVNLDPQLLLVLKEIHYLSRPPFNIKLPEPAKELCRNTNSQDLNVTATRLETIVSKYNTIMRTVTAFERPMFERKLLQIDSLLEQGLQQYTWKMKESADFIESAMSLVCLDVHQNLDIVQTNCHEVAEMTMSWSQGTLDVFQARDKSQSYSMDQLMDLHKQLNDELEAIVSPAGLRVHALVKESYEVVQISAASPAWRDYIDYMDAIVLDGLKQASLASLRGMLNTLVQANMVEDPADSLVVPILTIRLELIENNVGFRPPLDQSTSVVSVQELVHTWLQSYLARGKLVTMLGPKGSYEDYIAADEEVKQLLADINQVVSDNGEDCKKLLEVFKEYAFLWQQDVSQTFEDFLQGYITPNPLRSRSATQRTTGQKQELVQSAGGLLAGKSDRSSQASRASSAKSTISQEVLEHAERTFLTPKAMQEGEKSNVPSLDEFDSEIDTYRTARDEIMGLEEYHNVGWIRVDLQPIKQVLTTYASKWMWTFTKYLSDQVTSMLEKLDMFLKRIEPEIESITGEERDTASFMKMMRLFNEVSAQQSEMDGKFAAMHKTVLLLKKYGQILPEKTQFLFNAAPGRWNNLKTKVSLAKQRLGPRIQEESASITVDLEAFSVRVQSLSDDLDNSDVYQRECSIADAHSIVDSFSKRLLVLENEAQDLIELQELLEASVVNFSVLPTLGAFCCRHELNNLKQVWETVRVIEEQQSEWKRHRWQKMNTKFLREETNKQLDIVRALPEDVFTWDVYMGLHESITTIQACLPLIDDLSNPAMRTRHWKQLVRVTGGALTIDNDTLKRMTLKELLSLGLQQHVDDVRAIVQRAVKDLAIENALKTYEEVWLSKVFELRYHVRNKMSSSADVTQDNQSEYSQSEVAGPVSTAASRNARTVSRVSNQSSHSKNKRSSISSLPASLMNLGEVYTSTDVRQALSHDANRFSTANKDFRLLMRATEKNPNVLQCCSRKNILKILEHMNQSLEVCRKTLLHHLERRRQIFPRFFFLSMDDVLHIVCTGYDLNMVNLYISKVLQNIGCLVWEEVEDQERYNFIITGVQSALGERMQLDQAVCCEGQIETWLSSLVAQIKSSLQCQLSQALGYGKTRKPRLAHSPKKTSAAAEEPGPDGRKSQTGSQGQSPEEEGKPQTEEGAGGPVVVVTPGRAAADTGGTPRASVGKGDAGSGKIAEGAGDDGKEGKSWTLDHVTEIVHLATRVQTSRQLAQALESFDNGDKDALTDCLAKLDSSIKATVLLLKGLEGEKEEIIQSSKGKQEMISQDISGERDRESEIDLPGSPAFRKPSMDIHGHEAVRSPGHIGGGMEDEVDGVSKDGTATTLPVDTMNLMVEPTNEGPGGSLGGGASVTGPASAAGREEGQGVEGEEQEVVPPEVKLMLFPSQVHKLTSLLSLLAHLRDLVQRLIDISDQRLPTESFDWKAQLRYEFEPVNVLTTVNCLSAQFDYGFEYLGSSTREVISPLTERVFVMITQAVKAHTGMLCMGPREGTKFEIVHEMSKCLGQPLYVFNCTKATDYIQLQDIFRGLASTGCWVCFNDMSMLQPSCLSLLAQMMSTVMDALRMGKGAVHLQTDDVQLSPHGACFGLMNSSVPVKPHDSDKLLIYPSAAAQLPDSLLNQFRVISLAKPDFLLSLQVMLFSQGFLYGRELAWKANQLYETCQHMFGTNTFVTNNVTLGASRSASFYGWSLQSLKGVVEEAGAMLEKSQTEDKETGLSTIQEFGELSTEEDDGGTLVMAAKKLQQEEEALVTALRDTFLPRMPSRDASIFATIVNDLWPNVEVAMVFGGEEEEDDGSHLVPGVKKFNSLHSLKSDTRVKSSKSQDSQRSIKDSLKLNTPVVPMLHAGHEKFSAMLEMGSKQVLEDINDAIAVATADLALLPGTAFQARVMQLSQLNAAHQAILVVGPPGCGKSECIKTFAVAERERGKYINVQSIFTKAVETGELFGSYDIKTREWQDGLLTALLRKFCVTPPSSMDSDNKNMMKIMQLDGECDSYQMELLQSILNNSGSVVMANNERLSIPDNLRVIWELESLEHMSPSVLATVGVLVMSSSDVGWKLMLVQWLEHRNEPDKDLLTEFCNIYLETIVDYVTRCTQPAMLSNNGKKKAVKDGLVGPPLIGESSSPQTPQYKRTISHSMVNMVRTFINLLEVLVNPFNDLSDVEYERYFNYAAIWAFGGTLAYEHREDFSNWWREKFQEHIDYPPEGTVFDYVVDNESHEFINWREMVPSYTGTPHQGIPQDAFVHTIQTEQLLHLLGLLTDAGRPVMLVGENGCGKTAIINERIRTVCSGEVAEVLSLTLYANRNICLSLRPGCNKRNLLLLWQHEAFWVYGKRMVNEVDFRRFRQAFVTAVRKQFIDDDQIQTIIRPRSPLFTNLMEQDSGIVTAGMINTRVNQNISDEDAKTDLYRPAKSFTAVKDLLEKGVEEYNKIHPRIKMALYKTVIEQVCRLARTIASPHEGANSVLVAEGCPARCSVIVRLAANLCGYTIHQVTSTNPSLPAQARMDQFKADLVSGYTRAGAKGEHILLLLREEELAERDYLVYLTEFIISGAITHLFTYEEQTTIINSIRTEVTQAGLTYTRDVAWNFFLRTVRNNFRVMLVMCGGGNQFHAMCRDYPTLAKNVNFIWFPHWSKTQLIEHALFHVKEEMPWLSEMQQENVSHMLASMHLVLRQQDGGEQTCGEYCHVNNTSYQKFVERFISLANTKNSEVNRTHETVTKTLQQIRRENEVAIRLKKQLEHEMVVLEERKAGTIKILSQIGQDTAITEQQIRVVKNQLEKITHLKKRLPEYQVAHERAVYKAIAIVADTKKVVKLMDVDDLAELRGMQKPSLEIEDLMAAIIMLC
ncbi:dynein beta chain, flagellar outer arm [Elysia marginata]|uniref:Dynein beta chain, flagellar outer arm n=1 Tax=Elysia marginata TaxID=1093978 RepID=A0AAV4K1L5_9GAST|nr:dynein beta chain, flagellar outer arm [Elysia marginata]